MRFQKIFFISAVFGVVLLAAFFRLWNLDSTPPGLYPDVAINGINALDTLNNGDYKLFYPDNNGREGLIIWIEAFFFKIFGPSIYSLKLPAAIFGILTVWGVYLLANLIFKYIYADEKKLSFKIQRSSAFVSFEKAQIIALFSSFFMAVSFWHVNFSRIGFRAIMVPFFIVFGFYFLFKGFGRHPMSTKLVDIGCLLFSGIFFGLGFYTYISYRFVVFMGFLALVWLFFIFKKEKQLKGFWISAALLALAMIITALPLGVYFMNNLPDFFGRASDVSILKQGNPLLGIIKSLAGHLAMFNFHGDNNWRHNYSGDPQLIWPVGIFFIIGIIISIIGFIKSIKAKKSKENLIYIFLFSWFVFMMAPGYLSGEGVPHALRTIGAIPVAYIFAGIGAYYVFFEIFKKSCKSKRDLAIFYSCLFIFIAALAIAEFDRYFFKWGKNPETRNAFSQNLVDIGNFANSLPDNAQKYVIVNMDGVRINGIPMPAMTPIFIERAKYEKARSKYILPDELKSIDKLALPQTSYFILMNYDAKIIGELLVSFPTDDVNNNLKETNGVWVYKYETNLEINATDYKSTGCGGCKKNN